MTGNVHRISDHRRRRLQTAAKSRFRLSPRVLHMLYIVVGAVCVTLLIWHNRAQIVAAVTPGCSIKGNISPSTGERIYHVPGQTYYDAASIRFLRGERWFCTEADAAAAGFRSARL